MLDCKKLIVLKPEPTTLINIKHSLQWCIGSWFWCEGCPDVTNLWQKLSRWWFSRCCYYQMDTWNDKGTFCTPLLVAELECVVQYLYAYVLWVNMIVYRLLIAIPVGWYAWLRFQLMYGHSLDQLCSASFLNPLLSTAIECSLSRGSQYTECLSLGLVYHPRNIVKSCKLLHEWIPGAVCSMVLFCSNWCIGLSSAVIQGEVRSLGLRVHPKRTLLTANTSTCKGLWSWLLTLPAPFLHRLQLGEKWEVIIVLGKCFVCFHQTRII